ncbi:hypothetical protein CW362_32080 [Streptomyces populi]|uniref:Uncharacterized protein n=1 Tax=Streptomyces populi TaxID=2058924 RepID=A0A2I0SGD0_9ACTN|nr:hypothetical protein CW362_32080 [Streptomyces populi]
MWQLLEAASTVPRAAVDDRPSGRDVPAARRPYLRVTPTGPYDWRLTPIHLRGLTTPVVCATTVEP